MNNFIDIDSFSVLLVDDHNLFIEGLSELIKKIAPDSELECASSTFRAKEVLMKKAYTFLICDLMIPGENVPLFLSECQKKYPLMSILIVSSNIEISTVKNCFELGVKGYLSKAVSCQELKLALEKTSCGDKYISSDLGGKLANEFFLIENTRLTKRELEVLKMVAAGHSVEKTSKLLFVSPYTVMAHRRSIMSKLSLHSAAELVKYSFENKLN
jgi:DNA-binding NarL/FixJ family response regulator